MDKFEKSVAEYVLGKLLTEIDRGRDIDIDTSYIDQAGQWQSRTQKVNLKHTLISGIAHQMSTNEQFKSGVKEKIERMVDSESFKKRIAKEVSKELIEWLTKDDSSYWSKDKFPNKTAFTKEVRSQVVKIVASKKAAQMLREDKTAK